MPLAIQSALPLPAEADPADEQLVGEGGSRGSPVVAEVLGGLLGFAEKVDVQHLGTKHPVGRPHVLETDASDPSPSCGIVAELEEFAVGVFVAVPAILDL